MLLEITGERLPERMKGLVVWLRKLKQGLCVNLEGWDGDGDGRVMVERADRMWSTGEGNGKPLQYSCLENRMNSMKRQKDRMN